MFIRAAADSASVRAARRVLVGLVIVATYVATARASLLLATIHGSSSPVWPPSGLAIGLLIVLGLRWWPTIAAGALIANGTASGDWATSAVIAAGNTFEALVAAAIVHRLAGMPMLDRMRGVLVFFAAAALGAAVSASAGVGALVAGGLGSDAAGGVWRTWFLGNLAGTLIVAPLLVCWRWPAWRAGAALLGGAAAGGLAFTASGWPIFLLIPVAAAAAVLLSRLDLVAGVVGLAASAIAMTALGHGPFAGLGVNEALLLTQVFLVGVTLTILSLSAGIHRRQRRPNAASWAGAALAVAPLLAAGAFIGVALHPTIASLDAQRQDDEAQVLVAAWKEAVLAHAGQLAALRGLYESSDNVSRADFDRFVAVQGWTFGVGGATAVGYAHIVEPADLAAYEAATRADMTLPAVVRDGFAVFPPPTGRSVPVDHVYPMDPAPGAIGFDLSADPSGARALAAAVASGRTTATEPLQINTPGGEFPGFFLSLPVQKDGKVVGFVVLAQTVRDAASHVDLDIQYRIVDVTDVPEVLHETDAMQDATRTQTLSAWGRTWELQMAVPSTVSGTEAKAPWFILAGGAALSFAFAAVVYAHDTTRARAQDMSRSLVEQARRDADRLNEIRHLQDRDAFRRRFLNMVAHELRTPLTPIRAQAFLMRQRAREGDLKGLDILDRGVARLSAVVDDLLVAARLEAEGMALDIQPTDLFALAKEAVRAQRDVASATGTTLTLQGDPMPVEADPARIGQVIDNVVSNALKFAPGGRVDVQVRPRGGWAELIVEDNGLGIAPERLGEVGQPFVQVHDPDKVGAKGTGLGLYICKAIADLHDGRLDIESSGLGTGTRVTLRLPRQR